MLFFQAEDGIRYLTVTGVQTCALPICVARGEVALELRDDRQLRVGGGRVGRRTGRERLRSEERRVGEECRSRWSPDHLKKKKEDAEGSTRQSTQTRSSSAGV